MTTKTITRAAKPANAKGMTGKSSRKVATTKATESAKAKPAATGKIVESKGTSGGAKHYVRADDGRSTMIPTAQWRGEVRDAAAVGQNYDEFCKVWSRVSAAKLARGVDSRANPHSAKAVQDAKPAAPAKVAKPAKGTAATRRKAAKAAADATLLAAKIVLTPKGKAQLEANKDNGATRNVARLSKAGTVAKALEIGLKWGDINYAKKVGTITVG